MSPPEALAWLYSTQRFGIKLGLENTRRMLELSGHPERAFRSIHVAGTNGKGSVCAMAASILREAGFRVGLYTSPHLVDFRERIVVDDEWIAEDALAATLAQLREMVSRDGCSPTFFEVSTVSAYLHFASSRVEWAVVETGMGGRWDATNTLVPAVSVVTPIGMDHAEFLGGTPSAIAGEKAGIFKPGVPAVCAAQIPEVREVLVSVAARTGSPLRFVEEPLPEAWSLALGGAHQRRNAALALEAVRASGACASDAAARAGLARVRWPGRFERRGGWLLDAAHNPDAAAQLATAWRETFGPGKTPVVFGALADKDWRAMIRLLAPIAERFVFAPIRNPRAAAPSQLAGACPPEIPHRIAASVEEALAGVEPGDPPPVIAGSIYLLGEAIPLIADAR